MVIASRTPEGEPAQCPVCERFSVLVPSLFYSDAPCPSCGSLLWFVRLGHQNVLVQPTASVRAKGIVAILSDLTGISESDLQNDPQLLETADLDSLQVVEFVMQLEDDALNS